MSSPECYSCGSRDGMRCGLCSQCQSCCPAPDFMKHAHGYWWCDYDGYTHEIDGHKITVLDRPPFRMPHVSHRGFALVDAAGIQESVGL